jgi:transcriptional regulator with XRE-family HTH domain
MSRPPEPYWQRLKRMREHAGLSRADVFRRTQGIGWDTLRALERPYEDQREGKSSRSRYPSPETLRDVAQALGVDPGVFPEYRLARARQLLDERVQGLEAALRALEAFDLTRVVAPAEGDPAEALGRADGASRRLVEGSRRSQQA